VPGFGIFGHTGSGTGSGVGWGGGEVLGAGDCFVDRVVESLFAEFVDDASELEKFVGGGDTVPDWQGNLAYVVGRSSTVLQRALAK
jgi:hypothetical protein